MILHFIHLNFVNELTLFIYFVFNPLNDIVIDKLVCVFLWYVEGDESTILLFENSRDSPSDDPPASNEVIASPNPYKERDDV